MSAFTLAAMLKAIVILGLPPRTASELLGACPLIPRAVRPAFVKLAATVRVRDVFAGLQTRYKAD